MRRFQVRLTEGQREILRSESDRTGRSMSALVREAIRDVFDQRQRELADDD